MTRLALLLTLLPTALRAEAYDPPIPQAQSATAEFWFALATLGLVGALALVQWMVQKR
ncbi:protein NnrT [Tranquillimonas alkanivorans]|uniref:Protein NnrT n=1 Tax=Tranquillimonas alkanivorans TaxID=441119 RepID=A0A1I5X1T9_9RHOB|nr:protein NnrT [Tranquillimonas alkanivorans]SFQ25975.1 hypothetical protein SAMN04488047_1762 [Tranquillimonas alkanivorans]